MRKLKTQSNYNLPEFSIGWYAIAFEEELKEGKVITRKFAGDEVVIFKTESGNAVVMDAYCKHMGAHLGVGGEINGESITCPFHGFCFDKEGTCVKTGYDTAPYPMLNTFSWPVKVTGGVVFCYYHPERTEPTWQVDDLEDEEWTDFKFHKWELESNVVEIAENSVDIGHFSYVHKYQSPHIIDNLETDGHLLTAAYGMKRDGKVGKAESLDIVFKIKQQGLGLAVVTTEVEQLEVKTKHLVMAVPIDGDKIYLRIGAALRKINDPKKVHPMAGVVPKKMLTKIIHKKVFKSYVADVFQDFDIWSTKAYVDPPMLAKGDGPIPKYRKWAKQFDHSLTK